MATILVVDDEEQICSMLKELFELDGHSVLTASDGQEAQQMVGSNIDLAVVDIIMPHKSGLDFVHDLRQAWPDLAVLLMSGGGTFKSGSNDAPHDELLELERLIQKPFKGAEIRQLVGEMLGACYG